MINDSEDDEYTKVYEEIVNISLSESNSSKNVMTNTDDEKINELKEENKRLKSLREKYEKESQDLNYKLLGFREKEKLSVMQIIELLKLSEFLIKNIPNSKQLLNKYLAQNGYNSDKDKASKITVGEVIDEQSVEGQKDSDFEAKVDKNHSNSETDNESDAEVSSGSKRFRRSPRKSAKSGRKAESYPQRKRRQKQNLKEDNASANEDSDDSDDETFGKRKKKETILDYYGRGRKRVSNQSNGSQSDMEAISPAKPKPRAKDRSTSRSSVVRNVENEEKPEESPKRAKKVVKRQRRAEPEETGYFPCDFDRNQCDQVLQTKAAYDFHMSGHLDAKFICPFCAYTGPTVQIIKRHITTERECEPTPTDDSTADEANCCHRKRKMYFCNGCKVCHKIHERDENKCEHIKENKKNLCKWSHDIDHEFKDHLKEKHLNESFGKQIKNKDTRKQKIREIVDNFVDNQYFKNNAKKRLLVKKYQNNKQSSDSDDWD